MEELVVVKYKRILLSSLFGCCCIVLTRESGDGMLEKAC